MFKSNRIEYYKAIAAEVNADTVQAAPLPPDEIVRIEGGGGGGGGGMGGRRPLPKIDGDFTVIRMRGLPFAATVQVIAFLFLGVFCSSREARLVFFFFVQKFLYFVSKVQFYICLSILLLFRMSWTSSKITT